MKAEAPEAWRGSQDDVVGDLEPDDFQQISDMVGSDRKGPWVDPHADMPTGDQSTVSDTEPTR